MIEVIPAAVNIEIDSTQQFAAVGRDANMNMIPDLSFTWTSRYPKVGTIDGYGLLTGISAGVTMVTAKSGGIESAQVSVNVYDPVFSIVLSPESLALDYAATASFTAVGKDINGDDITGLSFTWTSDNPEIASVDSNGLVTGVSVGTTTITATLREVESLPAVVTVSPLPVTDIDGNVYETVRIGNQVWMAENLKVTHYRDGTAIPNITDGTDWTNLTTGAYCYYDNNSSNGDTYGALYNWYAVNDSRNIAPEGWHVPTDNEWQTLIDYLGGSSVAGGKLKEAGTTHWNSPNRGADNASGFTALPNGYRHYDTGNYIGIGYYGYFWSATETTSNYALFRTLSYYDSEVGRYSYYKSYGFDIRCLRDTP